MQRPIGFASFFPFLLRTLKGFSSSSSNGGHFFSSSSARNRTCFAMGCFGRDFVVLLLWVWRRLATNPSSSSLLLQDKRKERKSMVAKPPYTFFSFFLYTLCRSIHFYLSLIFWFLFADEYEMMRKSKGNRMWKRNDSVRSFLFTFRLYLLISEGVFWV